MTFKYARTAQENSVLIALAVVVFLVAISVLTEKEPPTADTGANACWVEDKADGTAERICGDVKLAPKGSHSFSDTVPNEDEPAFDCKADGNGICGESSQHDQQVHNV